MAALSEDDRRKILGDRFLEIEAAANARSGETDQQRTDAVRKDKAESNKINAAMVLIVGLILLISNYLAISGPTLLLVTIIAWALCALGVAWYVMQVRTLREIAAR